MREAVTYAISLVFAGAAAIALAQVPSLSIATGHPDQDANRSGQSTTTPSPNPDSQYRLGPDSMPQEGVPKGEIRGPYTLTKQCLSRNSAHVLGLRAGAIRSEGSGCPDGFSGRPCFQKRGTEIYEHRT